MTVTKPTIVFLTTYPPRECGIATFTQDLFKYTQKLLGNGYTCKVAAFNLSPLDTYKYPREVKWEIDQNNKQDYEQLAADINEDASVSGVILQHEYGIFGGNFGENILFFMRLCKKPILVTLHTALPSPDEKMKLITEEIIKLASNVVVLTQRSKEIIETVYPVATGKIFIIPHGIHPVPFSYQEDFKEKLELKNHTILTTFGLLSRGKGIEYVINALPSIIQKHPNVLYLILGETHPVIRRNEGEKYRLELASLIKKLGLAKYIKFYDQYLTLSDLLEFLQATDIYISTSIDPNQAVSGTLSYALGSGRAVVSTEFAQSKEIVTPDIGRLVPIKDSQALATIILELLSNPKKLKSMDLNAYNKTRPMLWSNVAQKYTNLLIKTIIPPLKLSHLYNMTDDVGLFQFANFSVPNVDFGYTLDDNARALILCSWLMKKKYNKKILSLINIYFSFIKKCYINGSFTNYIGFDGNIPTEQNEKEDLQDSQSRAMWALGEIMSNAVLPQKMRDEAKKMYLTILNKNVRFNHLRAKAHAIKSYGLALPLLPNEKVIILTLMKKYADELIESLHNNSTPSWIWFEKELKYNNSVLPEALCIAATHINNPDYKKAAIKSFQFLIHTTFTPDMYKPIGHAEWYKQDGIRSEYDQQPEDPASMILALGAFYEFTHDEEYKNLAKKCFSWFLGNNSINKPLYDEVTGGCFDGLHPDRVNLNQGAESLVSYLMSNYKLTTLYK